MKYVKKSVLLSLAVIAGLSLAGCKSNSGNNTSSSTDSTLKETETDSNSLRILRSDLQLSQETKQSQIKAEYLIKNNGYKDSDKVSAIITLKQKSLLSSYNDTYSSYYDSVSEYSESNIGLNQLKKIQTEQKNVISSLKNAGYFDDVDQTYQTVLNGFAVTITYGDFKKLESNTTISNIILGDTYNKAKTTEGSSSSVVENLVDVYKSGIFNSSSVEALGINGNGTAVAVLDSGFDCSHNVFNNPLNDEMITDEVVTKTTISENLTKLHAYQYTKNLKAEDLYYSKKIPYAYDYADKDYDVNPYDSEHGTHVAGIIGGNGTESTADTGEPIYGVAKYTQLVLMKVFADTSGGAESADLLAALDDAVVLGVDAINMSLGTTCGFNREVDEEEINVVYDNVQKAGISLVAAASNDYSSALGGPDGNTNKVTNPDSGTIGSPSSYTSTLSVASISGVKSPYIVANAGTSSETTFFFTESAKLSAKKNDFLGDLASQDSDFNLTGEKVYEYVSVPGTGVEASYANINVRGKIALVKRGSNTFDEKVRIAKKKGAIGIIIYNNVEGDISMTVSDEDHIPAASIRKDIGDELASKKSGTFTISKQYLAGPFMSDFSSWGPTPSLELNPEITAHGGDILSSIPGGDYERMSGTSMATPNMSGIIVLIRQYVKNNYPTLTAPEIQKMTYALLMSTATIALNEEGNPATPRKQGAGLASMNNVVKTGAYITVADKDKPKLELGDDAQRTGKYEMEFTINNISTINKQTSRTIDYKINLDALTETVSSSNKNFVAEKTHMLTSEGCYEVYVNGNKISNNIVSVPEGQSVDVKVVYTLNDADKKYLTDSFPFGMYVEGFVKAEAVNENEQSLNVPFLAFFGDWTEAPIFDKTFYEVESEAYDNTLDEEQKIKADYYATRPYGIYMYNYIIPLGTYIYTVPSGYEAIPGSVDHIAMSNEFGTIEGLSVVYAGALRPSKTMTYTITDNVTGEVIYEHVDYNARKAFGNGGTATPYYEYLRQSTTDLNLINNRSYTFNMIGTIDYGDGGLDTNVRNSFGFDFVMDTEAPIIKNATFEKKYDKTLKKDRYYVNLTVYDNHYVQGITPIAFSSSSSYTVLSDNPIPVYQTEKGTDTNVKIEITDYMDSLYTDATVNNAICFNIDDYALNANIFAIELPGTTDGFIFTKDGNAGDEISTIRNYVGSTIDLTDYMYVEGITDKSYLKYLTWTSANEEIAEVRNGVVLGKKVGRVKITVSDKLRSHTKDIEIDVRNPRTKTLNEESDVVKTKLANTSDISTQSDPIYTGNDSISKIYFDYFDTIKAYSLSDQQSAIGSTGDRIYLSAKGGISFYPGEKVKLHVNCIPYYVFDKYDFKYRSYDEEIATVSEDGTITGLKEGITTIELSSTKTNLIASVSVEVKNEFIIEGRTLVAYKGLGGDVVIPADKGILYIGSFAFSLYDTDRNVQNPDDDNDYNKSPNQNTTITSVVVPEGVEDIQKYAFYNCSALKSVTLPSTIRFVREYAFSVRDKDGIKSSLESINLGDVEVIGASAFAYCKKLTSVDLSTCYAMGQTAFLGCDGLTEVNISKLRNTGEQAFAGCANLKTVYINKDGLTKLGAGMFYQSPIENVKLYGDDTYTEDVVIKFSQIPTYAFRNTNIKSALIVGDVVTIGEYAFAGNNNLESVNIAGSVEYINSYAFANNPKLTSVILPNSTTNYEDNIFASSAKLENVTFQENTFIKTIGMNFLYGTNVSNFVVDQNNENYIANNQYVLNKSGETIVLAAPNYEYGDYVLPSEYTAISDAAFSGISKITAITLNNNVSLGQYAFANCTNLTNATVGENAISNYAFYGDSKLKTVDFENINSIGNYAFYRTNITNLELKEGTKVGKYAFANSYITSIKLNNNIKLDDSAFESVSSLQSVTMPDDATITIGDSAFKNDYNLSIIDLSKATGALGSYAFYGCSSIRSAVLTNVTSIGDYAFAGCLRLQTLEIPSVTSIGDYAFAQDPNKTDLGTPQITSIVIPQSVTKLGVGIFYNVTTLTNADVNANVSVLPENTFYGNTSLNGVRLSSTINEIGKNAFAACSSLNSINTENVKTFDEGALIAAGVKSVDLSNAEVIYEGAFANTKLTGTINAPKLVKIYDYAFQNAPITKFTANNLKYIGEGAFFATSLETFTLTSNIEFVDDLVFHNASSLTEINYLDGDTTKTSGKINDYAEVVDGILYTVISGRKLRLASVPQGKNVETLVVKEGTNMISIFAGAGNNSIKKIVLPDSLRTLGAFAFYQSTNIESVEFRSINAPVFEEYQIEGMTRLITDPGYEIIHKYIDAFGRDLYYANFIDLIGKNEFIKLIVPNNSDINGYDSIIFEAYFGGVKNAEKSSYTAMTANAVTFIDAMDRIMKLDRISATYDSLITNASRAYNNINCDLTKYGYSQEEIDEMVKALNKAEKDLREIKFLSASSDVKEVQALLDNLDTVFTISRLSELEALAKKLNALKASDRAILDLTNYNALVKSYEDYQASITPAIDDVNSAVAGSYNYLGIAVLALVNAASVGLLVYFSKKH